jgi:hypothetical protein
VKKLAQSTILNLGSLATFIALPLLYSATYGGGAPALWGGLALMAVSMAAPFAALKADKK